MIRGGVPVSLQLAAALAAVITSQAVDQGREPLSAEQFLRFVTSQRVALQDVAFAFEGEERYVGPKDDSIKPLVPFQGRYALRMDGATYLEHFYEEEPDARLNHPVRAMIRGKGEMAQLGAWPHGGPDPVIVRSGAGPGSYFDRTSPETFLWLASFRRLNDVSDFGYEFLGWEDVDGHSCAHIEFNPHPRHPPRGRLEFWLDLERGAHPLRIRNADGDRTVYLVDAIRLGKFRLSNNLNVWLPTYGRFHQYHHHGEYTSQPAFEITMYVLDASLVLNQGLDDGVFHVQGKSFRPNFAVKTKAPTVKARPKPIADVAGAEARLERELSDPKREARLSANDAAASLREESGVGDRLVLAAGLGGLALLAVAAAVAIRRRAAS